MMETEGDKSKCSNIIRVKLMKQKKYGLGFLVRKRSKGPHVVVSELVSNGTAAESGLVQIGDIILKVNDVSFDDLTYEKSVEHLKSLPVGVAVVLILKGPEGYTSHLETRFNQDGTPKTVRITKPILHSEGFIGRIRKTFSASATGRSCRTKQTQANCECHKTLHGEDTRLSRRNGDVHCENQCLAKSHLSHGSNEHTATDSTTNEANNSNTNLIHSTNSSETKEAANRVGTVSHINDTVSNNNSPKILSTELQKEDVHLEGNIGRSPVMNSSNSRANTMDALKEQKKCSDKIIDPLQSGVNKISDENISVFKDETLLCNGSDTKNKNSLTKTNNRDSSDNSQSITNKSETMVKKGKLENVAENGHDSLVNKTGNKTSNENGTDVTHASNDDIFTTSKSHLDGKVEKLGNVSAKSSPAKKFVKLRHVGEERPVCTDTLHQKAIEVR